MTRTPVQPSPGWTRAGAFLLAVSSLLLLVVVTAPSAGAEPGKIWGVTNHLGRISSAAAVDCPVADRCWAVEAGTLINTTDGGVSWADRGGLLPAVIRYLDDIACPTAGSCRVAARTANGYALLAIDPSGRTSRTMPAAAGPQRVDCTDVDTCVTTDGTTAFRTADAGRTWSQTTLPGAVTGAAVSCAPGTAVCWVVGRRVGAGPLAMRSLDAGATWAVRPLPARVGTVAGLTDIECTSATVCVAGGNSGSQAIVLTTRDAGASWRFTALAGGAEVETLSCSGTRTCLAVGFAPDTLARVAFSTTDGTAWSAAPAPGGFLTPTVDLGCAVALRCVLVQTGDGARTTAPDGAWVANPLPASFANVASFACPTVAACIGVGYDYVSRPMALRGTPGTWTSAPLPVAIGRPADIACVASTRCVLVSTAGDDPSAWGAWYSTDAGATWAPGTVPAGSGSAVAVSCATATTCLGVYQNETHQPRLLRTTDGGVTWIEVAAPAAAIRIDDISCPSGAGCVMIGRTPTSAVAWATTLIGRVVSRTALADHTAATFPAVACWSTTCIAPGSTADGGLVARSTDRGVTWTIAPAAGDAALSDVACASNGRCVLGGLGVTRPLVTTDGGVTWRVDLLSGDHETGALGCLPDRCFTLPGVYDHGPLALAE